MINQKKGYLVNRGMFLFCALYFLLGLMLITIFIYALKSRSFIPFFFYLILSGILLYYTDIYVLRPMRETNKTLSLFSEGYILKGIYEIRVPYSKEQEDAILKFGELMNTRELINSTKKHAEYLALQNQINPHFLYNTLEGIRSEALIEGADSVAEMTEALGTFFRYTISNLEKLVTLEEELANIENYYKIQQFRFGDRLALAVTFKGDQEKILKMRLPKLTLQPILENSIFHGVERKIGKGNIRIHLVLTQDRMIITISDDGLGMDADQLYELNQRLNGTTLEYLKDDYDKRGGIALVNVNNRIKLIFGDEYGIYVYSRKNAGTDVEVTLPAVEGDTKDD
ncbi:histidine kinase [Proteiniclasticum sp.]|uniref:sensor histidine kinase n=1 Tax=Proteiniclasticum sp. TaxID=2053595 RepID=UPI0028A145BB|nr:histidine kinase [Proteiniclasticum sp.]